MRALRSVGYWIEDEDLDYNDDDGGLELPDPRILLAVLGPCQVNKRVLAYLRSGRQVASFMGCSYCRFRCGVPDEEMGCCDLTDGVWVWPEGLAHYIEAHQVPLPEAFIATMEQNQWSVPEVANIEQLFGVEWSLDFWQEWYQGKIAG